MKNKFFDKNTKGISELKKHYFNIISKFLDVQLSVNLLFVEPSSIQNVQIFTYVVKSNNSVNLIAL